MSHASRTDSGVEINLIHRPGAQQVIDSRLNRSAGIIIQLGIPVILARPGADHNVFFRIIRAHEGLT